MSPSEQILARKIRRDLLKAQRRLGRSVRALASYRASHKKVFDEALVSKEIRLQNLLRSEIEEYRILLHGNQEEIPDEEALEEVPGSELREARSEGGEEVRTGRQE